MSKRITIEKAINRANQGYYQVLDEKRYLRENKWIKERDKKEYKESKRHFEIESSVLRAILYYLKTLEQKTISLKKLKGKLKELHKENGVTDLNDFYPRYSLYPILS